MRWLLLVILFAGCSKEIAPECRDLAMALEEECARKPLNFEFCDTIQQEAEGLADTEDTPKPAVACKAMAKRIRDASGLLKSEIMAWAEKSASVNGEPSYAVSGPNCQALGDFHIGEVCRGEPRNNKELCTLDSVRKTLDLFLKEKNETHETQCKTRLKEIKLKQNP